MAGRFRPGPSELHIFPDKKLEAPSKAGLNRVQIDLTMAYVGTRSLFEKAGFTKAADTDSVLNGLPRVLMRLDLR